MEPTDARMKKVARRCLALAGALWLGGCSLTPPTIPPPSEQPLSQETLALLTRKGMTPSAPIYIRIFKEESELEVWKARDDGHFYHFKTYPICNWSGELGPKLKQGDKQAPEGFYAVSAAQMNPNSNQYLAFNVGYPNTFDRVLNRDGGDVMVHGKCKSAGCYAMTDALIEEIYGLAREALRGGQQSFEVHAFPFRMTKANLEHHKNSQWYPFWLTLKQGYDHFEKHRVPPMVAVCEHRYIVNVTLPDQPPDPDRACPRFRRPKLEPFVPKPADQQTAEERITVPGPKLHSVAAVEPAPAAAPASVAVARPAADAGARYGLGAGTPSSPANALGFAPR